MTHPSTHSIPELAALRIQRNLVPLPYRRVSNQPYDGPMTEADICAHLLQREAYRRTDFIVLHNSAEERAVVAITRAATMPLFSPITAVQVIAMPPQCTYALSPETDCANPSALAELAYQRGLGVDDTLVVQGLYDHVNFIHRPDPIVVRIVEVVPPDPPKLYDLARRVIAYCTDLPPIRLELETIDLVARAREASSDAYLVPCRSGGLDTLGERVYFLDERPTTREAWTLVGCERSLQFHRHYYGDEPPRVEMCPRRLAGACDTLTMVKCCMLEFHTEREGNTLSVPWGTDLAMVEKVIREIVAQGAYV